MLADRGRALHGVWEAIEEGKMNQEEEKYPAGHRQIIENDYGECDLEDCPYWKHDEKTFGRCTFHKEKCYYDE